VAFNWGNRQLVEPSYTSYEKAWLRETTLRYFSAHIVRLATERLFLDDAESILYMLLNTWMTLHCMKVNGEELWERPVQ